MIDEPFVTAEYVAIADALRPHGGHNDRLEDLTWQQVVGIAAAAVAPVMDNLRAERDGVRQWALRSAEEAEVVVERATTSSAMAIAVAVESLAEARAELDGMREASRVGAARIALLEEVAVQAAARWGHERGPTPLRVALEAAGMI